MLQCPKWLAHVIVWWSTLPAGGTMRDATQNVGLGIKIDQGKNGLAQAGRETVLFSVMILVISKTYENLVCSLWMRDEACQICTRGVIT